MKDFVPTREGDLVPWLSNYAVKIPAIGAACNMSEEDIKKQQALALELIAELNNAIKSKADSKSANAKKNDAKTNNLGGIRGNLAHMKANPNWTPAMGKDLQADGTGTSPDPATYKASIKGSIEGGFIKLRIRKRGVQATNIYGRIGDSGPFVLLGRVSLGVFTDKRPLTIAGAGEIRQFYTMGVMYDEEIGQPSDIITVNFGG